MQKYTLRPAAPDVTAIEVVLAVEDDVVPLDGAARLNRRWTTRFGGDMELRTASRPALEPSGNAGGMDQGLLQRYAMFLRGQRGLSENTVSIYLLIKYVRYLLYMTTNFQQTLVVLLTATKTYSAINLI